MTDLFAGQPQAHARRDDPDTSHEAAVAISASLTELQSIVASYAARAGQNGFTDLQMTTDLKDDGSTFRTRRAELTERNIILNSGRRRQFGESDRTRIVWVHRDHVDDAPPIVDPPAPFSVEDRRAARQSVREMIETATMFRKQGYVGAADVIDRGAALLARLAR